MFIKRLGMFLTSLIDKNFMKLKNKIKNYLLRHSFTNIYITTSKICLTKSKYVIVATISNYVACSTKGRGR